MDEDRIFRQILAANMRRRGFLGLIGVAGAATLGACAPGGSSPAPSSSGNGAPKPGGLFRLGVEGGSSASPLDPHKSFGDRMNSFIGTSFYEQMNMVGNSGSIENVLAEELVSDAAGLVWTLRLKKGVEFHNGKTLDSKDVVFTINRILDPDTAATARGHLATIQKMRAVDATTVEFTLKSPQSWFDLDVADGGLMGIIPVGFDVATPVSTGPYKLAGYDMQGTAQFERFENYHGDPGYFDQVEIKGIVEDDARINALLSDQLDAAKISAVQAPRIDGTNGFASTNAESSYIQPLIVRVDEGPFASVDARQAMRYAINRQQVLDVAYGGRGRLASDVYGGADPAFDESLTRTQDLQKAKSLAEKAGLTTAGTIPITVTRSYEKVAQVMAENAREIGVDLRVDVLEPGAYSKRRFEWEFTAEAFPLTHVLSMAALVDGPDPGFNMTHFSEPEFNDLFAQASETTDAAAQGDIIKKMQKIQFERGGYIIPVFINTVYGHSDKVAGWIEQDASGLGINRSLTRMWFV